jgi:potassium/hydrogen antiporter
MDVQLILLAISLILFFGFFAEFIFKKVGVPDVLFLIILGFSLGPFGFKLVDVADLQILAPVFTTFTLLFLLFDGAFNINLSSLLREFSESFKLTLFNFILSSVIVMGVMVLVGLDWLPALLVGFMLGGVSSSFVIPILKQMGVGQRLYSLLTLESALTDVFCIVFSITVLEIIQFGSIGIRQVLTQLVSLFAIAGLVGIISGVIWIILTLKVFKIHNYMITVAYVILIFVLTQFLGGNGAIATLFFGLMLKNSKQLSSITKGLLVTRAADKKKAIAGDLGKSATTHSEEFFYHQLSFFLKTFFFVYIGILFDISDIKALVVGIVLSFLLMGIRVSSLWLTKGMDPQGRGLVNTMFARGLAAAAIAGVALQSGVPGAEFIVKVAYVTITGTIVLSSVKVFLLKKGITFMGNIGKWKDSSD